MNAYFQELADDECNPSPGEATHVRAKIQQTSITFHKIFQMEKDVVNRRLITIVDSCHFLSFLSTSMLPAPKST